jgi:hypothetical protein
MKLKGESAINGGGGQCGIDELPPKDEWSAERWVFVPEPDGAWSLYHPRRKLDMCQSSSRLAGHQSGQVQANDTSFMVGWGIPDLTTSESHVFDKGRGHFVMFNSGTIFDPGVLPLGWGADLPLNMGSGTTLKLMCVAYCTFLKHKQYLCSCFSNSTFAIRYHPLKRTIHGVYSAATEMARTWGLGAIRPSCGPTQRPI